MRLRLLLLLVVLAAPLALVAPAALGSPAAAEAPARANMAAPSTTLDPFDPTVTTEFDLTQCALAIPPPNCGVAPKASGDRGGWAQTLLFSLVLVATIGIFTVVFIGVGRNTKRRRAAAPDRDWV